MIRALVFLMIVLATPVLAVQPDEVLSDAALEARARTLSTGLRCLVCQNQSIDDSNAELARDLRLLVRERLLAGDTDQQVLDYLVERYGTYVLLEPPKSNSTLILWYAPVVLLGLGAVAVGIVLSRRRALPGAAPLNAEERARVDALLAEDDSDDAANHGEERRS
ncbi:MAG: cytochrome c-type biogenesis protein CcmH [Alphaproteobacteria bacterium]|nr:cytochrome c-type biogenesis protein CcmH [Alphaproteobacteria bacterium]